MTSSSYQIQQLVAKLRDGDPDLRIMGLMDVGRKAQEPSYAVDDATETQLVDQILVMFSDSIAEVKSLAAKTCVRVSLLCVRPIVVSRTRRLCRDGGRIMPLHGTGNALWDSSRYDTTQRERLTLLPPPVNAASPSSLPKSRRTAWGQSSKSSRQ